MASSSFRGLISGEVVAMVGSFAADIAELTIVQWGERGLAKLE
ncbi:hypothetical protein GCM10007082_00850 [Oceanisphaera arctica]|nr:hypothetical protein GCM10007082_00850 [Oceanisphaera arctica]